MSAGAVLLENVVVLHHDRVERRSLAFVDGVVADAAPIGARRIDLRGHFVYPGLINAHDHLQLNAIPALPHEEPFSDSYGWIAAFESHMDEPDVRAAVSVPRDTRLHHGGLKNLLAGATTVVHHDPPYAELWSASYPVNVLRECGWSHSLRLGATEIDGSTRYGPEVRTSLTDTPPGRPWIIHLAEGTSETAKRELACLDAMGCLAPNTVIVHGVGLGDHDVERVMAVGASVVWCPSSNLTMLGATLDPRRLADAGRLSLGTDSRLTGSRDLLDELRVAASCSDLDPRELLRLVTEGPRRAMRIADRGPLGVGARADCVVLRDAGDPYETLIRARRSEIAAVIRDGVICAGAPEFEDWFASAGVDVGQVRIDGRAALVARRFIHADAVAMERGFEVM